MTQPQLTALLRKWRKRLPLISNWKIRARFRRVDQMHGELGRVEFWPEMLRADIFILHPDDRPANPEENNPEADLVHELLHVVFDGHSMQQKYDMAKERALNQIAEALYRAYRPRKRAKKS